jgi:hypothetical protein
VGVAPSTFGAEHVRKFWTAARGQRQTEYISQAHVDLTKFDGIVIWCEQSKLLITQVYLKYK